MNEVFVFPLEDMVFFPTTTIPLNIFEPRYVRMAQDALASNTPIALTFLDPADPGTAAVGGQPGGRGQIIAGVGRAILYEERADQTMGIFVQGTGRARLGRIRSAEPYVICAATLLPEHEELRDESRSLLARLKKMTEAFIERTIEDAAQRQAVLARLSEPGLAGPRNVVELFALQRVQDLDLRQKVLEFNDINDRIRILSGII